MTIFDDAMAAGIAAMIQLDGKAAVLTRLDGSEVSVTILVDAISTDWQSDSSGRYEISQTNMTIPTTEAADIQIGEIITYLSKAWRIDSIVESVSSDTVVRVIYDECKAKESENRIKKIGK